MRIKRLFTVNVIKATVVLLSMFFSVCVFAQEKKTVNGRVTSSSGETLSGVSVTEKGTRNSVMSDAAGKYTIHVKLNAVLVFSMVGYTGQEVSVVNGSVSEVVMAAKNKSMDEVVVVGYGTQRKRDLATATSRVSAADVKDAIITTVDQALQGRTTGVQVVEVSGEPGAATVIRIRGNNSLSGNNEPLYVIDGFPMPPYAEASTNFTGAYSQNGLYGINPNDIESMEVLKDASATAIYGSRGANGVVLITTKAGKRGDGRVELVNKTTFGKIGKPIKMMNGREFAKIVNETYTLYGYGNVFPETDTTSFQSTDWFDAVSRNSSRQDISLNVSGGSPKSSYYISGNYLFDKGTLLNSDNGRGSLRANLNNDVTSWYTIKSQISVVRQKANRAITVSHGWPDAGGLMDALRASPLVARDYLGYNGAGVPGYAGYWFDNPYNELTSKTDISKNDYSILNLENWFTITSNLKLVATLGGSQNLTRREIFMPASTAAGHSLNGSGSSTMANTYSYNVNAYFLYDKTFKGDHKLNATLGGEYNTSTLETLGTYSSNFDVPSFGIYNIGSAQTQTVSSYREDRTLQSGFLRANYSYKGRYVLNTSLRLDGASPFAQNKKYGWFPAAAVAWNLSEEEFMKQLKGVTNAKVRMSYGKTGSQAISPYSSLAQYSNAFYQLGSDATTVTALYAASLGNANLSWEKTQQFNAGFDFNVWQNRLGISFDFYNKVTNDLLQSRTLPTQSGFGAITDNYGAMRNRGVELSLQADVIRLKKFRYSTRFNISHNKTILLNLGDKTTSDYVAISGNLLSGVSGIMTPGKEIGRFYGYRVAGLAQVSDFTNGVPNYAYPGNSGDQHPGTWKYEDVDKNGTLDDNDRQVLGKSSPDFTYGWTNDLTYKGIGLSLFFTGSVGNNVLNLTRFYLNDGVINYSGVIFNQTEDWYKHRWTTSNQHNDPRYPATQSNVTTGDITNTMVENGSYFRLKMLTVSYQLPINKVIKNPRIFATGTNVFTITKYTGYDPEVSAFNQSLLQQGIDYGSYPSQRSYTIGFSCNF